MLDHFQRFLNTENLQSSTDIILIGISGGVDSVSLAHLFLQSGFKIGLAHVNYGKRGEESEKDEALIQFYAKKWGVPFYLIKFPKEQDGAGNFQERARKFRYEWFESLASQNGYNYIAVGHHADDQIETFFLNVTRAAGLRGLTSIKSKNGSVIRPLLTVFKSDLYDYANREGLEYREDASNYESDYARNYLRNEIIPSLEKRFPGFRANTIKSIFHLNKSFRFTDWMIQQANFVVKDGASLLILLDALHTAPDPLEVLYWTMQPGLFSETQLSDIYSASPGSIVESDNFMAIRERHYIRFFPISSLPGEFNIEIHNEGEYELPHAKVCISSSPMETSKHALMLVLGYSGSAPFPLVLRNKKQGDVFKPKGMHGMKKTIKKMLSDLDLDYWQRQRTVILESTQELAAILPYRIAHQFDPDKKENQMYIYFTWK